MTFTAHRGLIAAAVVTAAALTAVALWKRSPAPPVEPSDVKPGWTAATVTDGEEIFRRAFWRRPSAQDRIIHAERTEWTEPGTGIAKWQWHLIVEPGQDLKQWLFEKNAFSLQSSGAIPGHAAFPPVRRPEWFPEQRPLGRTFQSGSMTITVSSKDGRIYASDSGHGFAAGHPDSILTPTGSSVPAATGAKASEKAPQHPI